jgi:hypothetical protein
VPLIFFAARERACDEIRVLEINSRKLTNDLLRILVTGHAFALRASAEKDHGRKHNQDY